MELTAPAAAAAPALTAAANWINTTFSGFDQSVATAVHKLYGLAGGFFNPFFVFVSYLGKGGIFLIVLSLALLLYRPTRRFGTAMCIGLAIGALAANVLIKPTVARPRPYMDEASIFHQYWMLVGQTVERDVNSFPSGHTTAAFDSMVPVFLLAKNKKSWLKIVAVCFAVLMGIARIYLCVHFASDVLGGMIIGILAGIIAVLIGQRIPKKWYRWELGKKALPAQAAGKHEIK